jgi:hypothetical protein
MESKKIGFWEKVWNVLKVIGAVILSVFAVLGGIFVISKIPKIKKGKVVSKINWSAVKGEPDQIFICTTNDPEDWQKKTLPKGMTTKDIKAVGMDKSKNIVMESKHEKIDRRNSTSVSNSALARIRARKRL